MDGIIMTKALTHHTCTLPMLVIAHHKLSPGKRQKRHEPISSQPESFTEYMPQQAPRSVGEVFQH
jgi:hypothetical protein